MTDVLERVLEGIRRDLHFEEKIMKRIKEARLNKGLSPVELGKRLGAGERLILNWEKDGSTASQLLPLGAVARALGVTAAYLLTGDEAAADPPDETDRYIRLILNTPWILRWA
jgi:transcriptional regulator with XRE-family HTH domain